MKRANASTANRSRNGKPGIRRKRRRRNSPRWRLHKRRMAETAFDLGDVIARPYRDEDAPALLAAVRESVESVGRWLPWCTTDYNEQHAIDWIAHCRAASLSGDQFAFGVFDANDEFLGAVGLSHRNREHNCAGIGYWIRE